VIEPGSYAPPPPGPESILLLPSNLELAGYGAGITILNGHDATDLTSIGPVLVNANPISGNENITVRDLEINGGWTNGDATGFAHSRMGVYYSNCTNCRVESTTVRDTLHSCLYSKNGTNVYFDRNTLLRCGNYRGAGGERYPCVYLYANDNLVQENVFVTDNYCDGSGAAALNTRRQSPAAILQNIHFSGNTVRNTRAEETYARRCIVISGIDRGVYTDNSCVNTGSLFYYSEAYYADEIYPAASRNIRVDNLQIIDPYRSHGLEIHGYLEDATFRNIQVSNVDEEHDCMVFTNPLKNVKFEDIELASCGRMGIYETSPVGSGPTEEEGLTFRRVDILGVDGNRLDDIAWPAIKFRGLARNLLLEDFSIVDASGDGIVFGDDLVNSKLKGIDIAEVGGHGISVGPNAIIDSVVFSGNTIDGSGLKGLDLQLDPTQPSQGIEVSGSTFRDFGRDAPGSAAAGRVEISGAATGLTISNNVLEDVGNQGQYGIVHDVWPLPVDTSKLCKNDFTGTFVMDEWYFVAGMVSEFQVDTDADQSVDGCDCAPSDPITYPDAAEVNDGLDNQCPGDHAYGVIDEISGDSGFHNPVDRNEYSWSAQSGAMQYEVARSTTPDFSADCISTYTYDPYFFDSEEPSIGDVYYYLNRPLKLNIGSWGQDSAAVERVFVCD